MMYGLSTPQPLPVYRRPTNTPTARFPREPQLAGSFGFLPPLVPEENLSAYKWRGFYGPDALTSVHPNNRVKQQTKL